MFAILMLGFLIGMKHALEADHVAAVASLATRSRSVIDTCRQGAAWGVGHTLTLLVFGGLVLVVDTVIPERLAQGLELAVGLMLVLLGADVLRRLVTERVHFHLHRHGEQLHVHAHAHEPGGDHSRDPHAHSHPSGLPLRSLLVGMMHGMAGSAALIILTLGTVQSPWEGLAYILLFGLGSVVGMALLALAIAIPLRYSARRLTVAHNALKAVVGLATLGLGGTLVYEIGIVGGLLV
jgi:cytochrome c biogenesis protein CcdA